LHHKPPAHRHDLEDTLMTGFAIHIITLATVAFLQHHWLWHQGKLVMSLWREPLPRSVSNHDRKRLQAT
jgi:hypothetical protein